MFGPDSTTFVIIEAVAGSGAVEFYHQGLHDVKFEVGLFLGLSLDCGEDFRFIEVDVAGGAILLMFCDTGRVPFLASNIALVFCHTCFGSASSFAYIGVARTVVAITRKFVDDSFWGKLHFVFPTNDILKFGPRRENDAETSFA